MSQITAHQYAQALYDQLLETPDKKRDQLISDFVETVKQHHQSKLSDQIIAEIKAVFSQKEKTTQILLISSTPLNNLFELSRIISLSLKKDIEIKNLIDPKLIGGIIIYYQDYKIDFSLKNLVQKSKTKVVDEFLCMDHVLNQIIEIMNEHQDLLFSEDISPIPSEHIEIVSFTASNKPAISKIEKQLSAKLHQKVIIRFNKDPELIAGAVIEYDHKKIDASFNKIID